MVFTLLSGRIYPQGVFNWQFSPSVQSTQLIHRCWDDMSSKKEKKGTNILLKAFCHTSRMNTILTSMEKWNQMLVLPVGVNCTKIYPLLLDQQEQKWSQGENVINLKAAAHSVRAKDKERGRKKNRWSAFTILCFSTQDWSFLFPVPHRVRGQRLVSVVCLGSRIVVFT